MSNELTMSVSCMTRNKDEKAIYILFSDGQRNAEFAIPGCKLISNNGFTQDEINQLMDYINSEQDQIHKLSKEANPIRGMMR